MNFSKTFKTRSLKRNTIIKNPYEDYEIHEDNFFYGFKLLEHFNLLFHNLVIINVIINFNYLQ